MNMRWPRIGVRPRMERMARAFVWSRFTALVWWKR